VPSGQDAIRLLSEDSGSLPDLIFLDLNMPGMDGKTCLDEIKRIRRASHIPVVVYSTSSYHKDVEETKSLGAAEFINKPSDYTELCLMIKKIFDDRY
jgi:CheY-like chemotaxis protein